MLLLFLAGLGITLYPRFQGASVDAAIVQDVASFYEWLEEAEKAAKDQDNSVTGDGTLDLNDYINK